MYVIDGIAYARERFSAIQVCEVRPLDDFRLWVRFHTGEAKVFDLSHFWVFPPLLLWRKSPLLTGCISTMGLRFGRMGKLILLRKFFIKKEFW